MCLNHIVQWLKRQKTLIWALQLYRMLLEDFPRWMA